MNQIAMTLGRTQPPHRAHIDMLANALLSLKEGGQLIHFVSSSNVPISLSPGSVNILTTEQRIDLLTQGLEDEIRRRHAASPSSIPAYLARRIETFKPFLSAENFRCIPLPDFSDQAAHFDTLDLRLARTAALNIVKQASFQKHVKAQGNIHSDSYFAWAVHLKTLLDEAVNDYCLMHPNVSSPKVTYFTCTKDNETQQYVAVILDMMTFLSPATYDFCVNFTPVDMIDGEIIQATDIRTALLSGSHDAEALKWVPKEMLEKIWVMIL